MRQQFSPSTISPTWQLAWGRIDHLADPIWRDQQIAIVSPSTSGTEPIFAISSSQRFVVIGDVWLSQRDRLLLRFPDDRWQSASDLHLIAAAWEQWGIKTLEQLIGMFCIAVWDRDRQQLWLIRDRVGARTLYYTTTGATRWIAPNLRSLSPYRSSDLDLVALQDYLCCAFVPGERTLWQQVRELRPGTVFCLPGETIEPYWQPQEQILGAEQPITWHSDRLRPLLEQVVQEALPTDQPVGVFLSGGLDSSSITALTAKLHHHPVHTYSIHFGAECPNELEFSSLVAQHCQTQHHILEIPLSEMWAQLPPTMAYLDDPIGDPLTVPNLLLGRLAKESVSVILNGEGGDPCFGGPKNQPMLLNSLYRSVTTTDSLSAYLRSFQKCAADLPQLLQPDVWGMLPSTPSVFLADLESPINYLNRLMGLNIKFKGADHILTKVNNLTQAVGLQGRSPLFDARLVELSMQIPPNYKLSGVQEKAVLKQAVIDLLPDTIVQRPKSGMMVPVQFGFRQDWNRPAKALLLSRRAAIAPYLNQVLIRNWLNYQGDPWGRYGVKLWLLVSLELWLQAHQ